jgi:predicted anti-sigma-YlaC factor YlaD
MDGSRIQRVVELVLRPWVATCAETREHLSAHLEGELRGRESKRVLRHLARCPRCREVLRSLSRAVDALRSLGQADASPLVPSAADSVIDRLRHDPG